MNIVTQKGNWKKEIKGKVIRKSYIARELLACEHEVPNRIIDIKPDRDDPDHKRSVFVFEDNMQLQEDLDKIMNENRFEERVRREVEMRIKKMQEEKE